MIECFFSLDRKSETGHFAGRMFLPRGQQETKPVGGVERTHTTRQIVEHEREHHSHKR